CCHRARPAGLEPTVLRLRPPVSPVLALVFYLFTIVIVPVMSGWARQKYLIVPGLVISCRADCPATIMTSHSPLVAVAVWSTKSLFTHSTVSPALTVISAGEKARSLI